MIERLKNEPVLLAAVTLVAAVAGLDLSEAQLLTLASVLAVLVRRQVSPVRKGSPE